MISYLEGKIVLKREKFIILNTQGVGFKVFLTSKNLEKMGEGQEIKIFCFLDARERAIELYGFLTYQELELFESLKSISGVGSKVALKISSLGSLKEIKEDIEERKTEVFEDIPGVGKKRAQKIILELTGEIEKKFGKKDSKEPQEEEAVQALVNLGFAKKRAKKALSEIPEGIKSKEEKIKEALKILGK